MPIAPPLVSIWTDLLARDSLVAARNEGGFGGDLHLGGANKYMYFGFVFTMPLSCCCLLHGEGWNNGTWSGGRCGRMLFPLRPL